MTAETKSVADKSIEKLGLDEATNAALREIRRDVEDAYRDALIELTEAVKRQASALDRIQTTLSLLLERVAPEITVDQKLPIAFSLAAGADSPDVAKALVIADPIAAGYTLNQSDVARLLALSQADVSALVRAFNLAEEDECAVVVRQGKSRKIVNYHPRALGRLRDLILNPSMPLSGNALSALERSRRKLALAQGSDVA
jgi:hypothetical protein